MHALAFEPQTASAEQRERQQPHDEHPHDTNSIFTSRNATATQCALWQKSRTFSPDTNNNNSWLLQDGSQLPMTTSMEQPPHQHYHYHHQYHPHEGGEVGGQQQQQQLGGFDDDKVVACSFPLFSANKLEKWQAYLMSLFCMVILVFGSYYLGGAQAEKSILPQLEQVQQMQSVVVEAQARILSEKAELLASVVVGGGREQNKDIHQINQELSREIEQVHQLLRDKDLALKEEEQKRTMQEIEIIQLSEQYNQFQINNNNGVSQLQRQRRQDDLAKLIKTLAYDRYGAGNQRVEFHVRIRKTNESSSEHENAEVNTNASHYFLDEYFVVEVAGLERNVPISSFLFLQQVEHGLWDTTSFPIKAEHVLMAEPSSLIKNNNKVNRLPEMRAMGLGRLLVHEYSDDMPHIEYTVGFGGFQSDATAEEAAGSYFLINTIDNTHDHHGQACFGRVVQGFETIDKIMALETNSNLELIPPVDIVSARLLPSPTVLDDAVVPAENDTTTTTTSTATTTTPLMVL